MGKSEKLPKNQNHRTAMLAFLLVLALAAGTLVLGALYTPPREYSLRNAALDLTGYRRFDDRMIYLDGEWEYFADKLIETEKLTAAQPDGMLRLPADFAASGLQLPKTGKASFRITLTNVPEDVFLTWSIPGMINDYKLFISGQPFREPIGRETTNYFPFLSVSAREGDTVELVIEVDQAHFSGIDKCPVLSDSDLQFNNYFLVRIVFFTMVGLLLSAFIILPLTYNIFSQSLLRRYAVIGCLGLLSFILETLWFYGVLGIVQRAVDLPTQHFLRMFTEAALGYCVYQMLLSIDDEFVLYRRRGIGHGAFAVCMALSAFLAAFGQSMRTPELILGIFALLCALLAVGVAIRNVLLYGKSAAISGIGGLSMVTGILFKNICLYAESQFTLQMVLPVCMVVCLVCWSLLIADSRKVEIAALQKALDAEQTTAKTQAAFLASQIQPHFLYNTLTTIQELCYTDPSQAADTVVRFSEYLRQNIDFMDYKDKIPFAVELGHIDNYIDLQRTRFGDAVHFERNIAFEAFSLPPLTVQPLIENAVSHGIRKNNGTGTVKLTVRRAEREILITVEDDGEGFNVEAVHSRSLENIRRRIEGAMHGSVQIDSKPGMGARITIRFPYKEARIREDCGRG